MLGRITVLGCGLIGGSIIKGLRERGGASSIAAVDRADVVEQARPWLDAGAEPDTDAARHLAASADLVVLAAPVFAIAAAVGRVLESIGPAAAVTDCGSVKRVVVERAAGHPRRSRFVPGHPMAGREVGGFAAASAALFEGSRWYLMREGAAPDAFARAATLAAALGAAPVEIGVEEHDRAMAYVSHVPQLVASALVDLASASGALTETGPGFRDTTRIAGGPASVWRDIFGANSGHIGRALAELVERLSAARDELLAHAANHDAPPAKANEDDAAAALDRTMAILERARRARGS